jgi:hypothetical protein
MPPGDPVSLRRPRFLNTLSLARALVVAGILSTWICGCSDNETNPPAPHEADLLVVRFSPDNPQYLVKPGDRIDMPSHWLVENVGEVAAGAFDIGYYLSADDLITTADALIHSQACPGLDPTHDFALAESVEIPAGTAPGAYYVGVLLDRNGQVPESNEANNTRSVRVDVTILSDLMVSSAPVPTPSSAFPDERVFLSAWDIWNIGTTTSAPSEYGYYLSTDSAIDPLDIYLGGGSAPAIPRDSIWTADPTSFPIPLGTISGDYYLGVLVDRTGSIQEYIETNNDASLPFRVAGVPDLVVSSGPITATPTSVVAGDSVELSAGTIQNIGGALHPNLTSWENGFFLSTDATINTSDVFLGAALGPPIQIGPILGNDPYQWLAASVQIPADTPPGSYYIGVMVDRTHHIPESDETNNYVSTPITVIGPP